MLDFSLFDFSPGPHLHYHQSAKIPASLPPVEFIEGNEKGWAKEVVGDVHVKSITNRTTLRIQGPGAMKINGTRWDPKMLPIYEDAEKDIKALVRRWQILKDKIMKEREHRALQNRKWKSRNQPCWCGSEVKQKKCHG